MEAQKFDLNLHYEEMNTWAKDRGIGPVPRHLLPTTGRIVPGVAACFLYLTDSGIGFLENMISNPYMDKKQSGEALDACVRSIEKDAKEKGVSVLWSSTCIPQVMERAEKLGFHVQKKIYKLILKGI